MSERDIQEALNMLHDTQALVSNSCWKVSSLEEPSFLKYMEKIQREMCNIKGNLMSFIFYIKKKYMKLPFMLHIAIWIFSMSLRKDGSSNEEKLQQ